MGLFVKETWLLEAQQTTVGGVFSMTEQEVFNKVYRHLLAQNKRCEVSGECRYRLNNMKCAVGCIISDDAYSYDLEGVGVASYVVINALKKSGVVPTDRVFSLLFELQDLHDNNPPNLWRYSLERIAAKRGLEVPSD